MREADVDLGYLAFPAGGPVPGIVMVHDVWGLADHTRDLARRLAGAGFAVLAVDLYRRESEVAIENPGVWMRELSDPQAIADVEQAAAFLRGHEAVAGGKVGVTGFCMGGMYALLTACGSPGIDASVAYYGLLSHAHGMLYDADGLDPAKKPREPLAAAAERSCPLLCFFGDGDEFVPLSDIERLREQVAGGGPPAEVVVYPGCGHAFMNDTRADAFRPEAAERAWDRMLGFFREHLA